MAAQEDALNPPFGIPIAEELFDDGENWWTRTSTASLERLDVHSKSHPMQANSAWAWGREMMTFQWLTIVPQVKAKVVYWAEKNNDWRDTFDTVQDVLDAMDVVVTATRLADVMDPNLTVDEAKHTTALQWLARRLLYGSHETKIKEIVGAALTMKIRQPEVKETMEGGTLGLQVEKVTMDRSEANRLLLRLGQALRNLDGMRTADLQYLGMEGDFVHEIRNWRNIIGGCIRTEEQATIWQVSAKAHLKAINLPKEMLIGPQDFAVPPRISEGWEWVGTRPERYSNAQNELRSVGETLLSASLGRMILDTDRWLDDDLVTRGIHDLAAADTYSLQAIGPFMFMLGQYSKDRFAWARVGSDYWTVILRLRETHTVVGDLSMLERGPEISEFTRGQIPWIGIIGNPNVGGPMQVPDGKLWILQHLRAPHERPGRNEMSHPVGGYNRQVMMSRLDPHTRELTDIRRDPWTLHMA